MKTIPESKQHVRPLSSKMRGISGITSLLNGEADLSALNRTRPRRHGDLSSASSVASEESDGGPHASDEVSSHEITRIWASSHDALHPARHALRRNRPFRAAPPKFARIVTTCPLRRTRHDAHKRNPSKRHVSL